PKRSRRPVVTVQKQFGIEAQLDWPLQKNRSALKHPSRTRTPSQIPSRCNRWWNFAPAGDCLFLVLRHLRKRVRRGMVLVEAQRDTQPTPVMDHLVESILHPAYRLVLRRAGKQRADSRFAITVFSSPITEDFIQPVKRDALKVETRLLSSVAA